MKTRRFDEKPSAGRLRSAPRIMRAEPTNRRPVGNSVPHGKEGADASLHRRNPGCDAVPDSPGPDGTRPLRIRGWTDGQALWEPGKGFDQPLESRERTNPAA